MMRPMLRRESLLDPFSLHRFLKRCHHALRFVHQPIDQMGTFAGFHGLTPYCCTPSCRSKSPISSRTLRLSVPLLSTLCQRSGSYLRPSSSIVSGAPCVDSSPCSTRSRVCKACG